MKKMVFKIILGSLVAMLIGAFLPIWEFVTAGYLHTKETGTLFQMFSPEYRYSELSGRSLLFVVSFIIVGGWVGWIIGKRAPQVGSAEEPRVPQ